MIKFYLIFRKYTPLFLSGFLLLLFTFPSTGQLRIMVKTEAEGGVEFTTCANHTSWPTASYELQKAIDAANEAGGGEIWVSGGTYLPTVFHNPYTEAEGTIPPEDDRNRSFIPKNGVIVIGGFAGTEASREDRPDNLFEGDNATILSGDIGTPGDSLDNSYHVIFCPIGTDNSALLKDLIIAHGNANGKDHPIDDEDIYFIPYTKRGGGLQARGGGFFDNCRLRDNYAETLGGGAYLYKGGLMWQCEVFNNKAGENGGGIHAYLGATVSRSRVHNNHAEEKGGGIFVESGTDEEQSTLSHSFVFANSSNGKGGGIGFYNGGMLLNNLIFNNKAIGNGGGIHLQDNGGDANPEDKGLVINNTIVANEADGGAGLYADNGGEIKNTVIWGNQTPYPSNAQFSRKALTTHADYCAIQNLEEAEGITNLIVLNAENTGAGSHPVFFNPVSFTGLPGAGQMQEIWDADYQPGLESALLNTGTPDVTGLPLTATDLNGSSRIIKGRIDIGAYETLYYTVTSSVTSGAAGTLEPTGITNVLPGTDHLFTLTPEANHQVASFTLNGTETKDDLAAQDGGFVYTLSEIAEDIEAIAEFAVISGIYQARTANISIFPNPATDLIHITGDEIKVAEIFSVSGKLMKSLNTSELKQSIPVSNLAKGIYFVITTRNNGEQSIFKLIKR